ncbi:MAG: winged helix-turn-helix transcriptional regulator [Deltaproteobacteria bacterium]|nr:winged helix-turn-helix transcriptional regulator [Deltaproteobacteria bacterium]
MDSKQKARYEAQAGIIKALAHPSRLFIVEELNRQKRCVSELTEMIGVDTSTVSKHLGILKNAGLVLHEKKGTTVYYQLRMPCLLDFINCVESVMAANALGQMETVISCKIK